MFGDQCLWVLTGVLALLSVAATAYYGAIVSGMYKDPLLARFRKYGEEHLPYPVCRFLESVGLANLMIAIIIGSVTTPGSYFGGIFPPLIFIVLAVMAFVASFIARRKPILGESLPRWYFELLHTSTRQERRFLGFAWLRIPRKMRWRLNGDQAAFRVWADMVRISVIYGAREPDDPWRMWV